VSVCQRLSHATGLEELEAQGSCDSLESPRVLEPSGTRADGEAPPAASAAEQGAAPGSSDGPVGRAAARAAGGGTSSVGSINGAAGRAAVRGAGCTPTPPCERRTDLLDEEVSALELELEGSLGSLALDEDLLAEVSRGRGSVQRTP